MRRSLIRAWDMADTTVRLSRPRAQFRRRVIMPTLVAAVILAAIILYHVGVLK